VRAEIVRLIEFLDRTDICADFEPNADEEPLFCDLRGGTLIGGHHG
jgi:hypothetical protein